MPNFCKASERQCVCSWILRICCLAVFFSTLFYEAHLNIQIRKNDYELIELNHQRNALKAELLQVNSALAQVKPKDFMDVKAEELGLQSPDVQQYQLVQYREVPRRAPALRLEHLQIAPGPGTPVVPASRMEMALRPGTEELPPAPAAPLRPQTAIAPVALPESALPAQALEAEDPELSFMAVSDMLASL